MSDSHVLIVKEARLRLPAELIASVLDLDLESAPKYKYPTLTETEILDYVIDTYSRPNEIVVDPMAGVGTFVRRALKKGRNAFGVEVVNEYMQLANELIRRDFGLEDRVRLQSALSLTAASWISQITPANLCFFSPPLLRINRPGYPVSSEQIGNYPPEHVQSWFSDIEQILAQIQKILKYQAYLAINWRNQRNGDTILPLATGGVMCAINLGYRLVDEKVALFSLDPTRYPEMIHVFQKII